MRYVARAKVSPPTTPPPFRSYLCPFVHRPECMRAIYHCCALFLFPIWLGGQPLAVSAIEFEGYGRNDSLYLRRFVQHLTGSPLDEERVRTDVFALRRLPGIAHAEARYDTLADATLRLVYVLQPQRTLLPIAGLGGIQDNFWVQAGLVEYNLRGRNQTLLGYYLNNDRRSGGQLYYANPRYRGGRWGYAADLRHYASIEPLYFPERVDYDYQNTGAGLTGFHHPNLRTQLTFGLNYFEERYAKLRPGEGPGPDRRRDRKLLCSAGVQRNGLEYDYFYRKGGTQQLLLQQVSTLGVPGGFWSAALTGTQFWRPSPRRNIGLRYRAALATNRESPFAPFVLDSQFKLRGVGNRVDRGTAQFVVNLELRQTLYDGRLWALQGIAFLDAGTWRNPGGTFAEAFNGSALRTFVGPGLRLINKRIFQFILRIDYGVDVRDAQQRGWVLGVGQYF